MFCLVLLGRICLIVIFVVEKRAIMEILKVILLAIGILGIGILGMAIRIVLKKGGRFPNTHVSGNRHLKRKGVYCAQTQDKLAQRSAWKEVKYDKVSFSPNLKAGK
jgi:hypothetical protein